MIVRTIFGLCWSFIVGLAGGWLILAPWALNEQGSGGWTSVTGVQFGTGLGLVAFALVGFIVIGTQVAQAIRTPRPRSPEQDPSLQQANVERALMQLASRLVAEMDRPPAAAEGGADVGNGAPPRSAPAPPSGSSVPPQSWGDS